MSRSSFVSILLLAAALSACPQAGESGGSAVTDKPAAGGSATAPSLPGAATSPDAVVAKIGEQAITYADLDKKAAARLVRLATQAYDIRKQALDEMIDDQLLENEAKTRGISKDDVLKAEIKDKIAEVSDEDARKFFEENPPRGQVDFDRMKPRFKEYLGKKQEGDLRKALIDSLRSKAGVTVMLEPMRFDVAFTDADPVKGNRAAPIQIVEYSDFQCPYCSKVLPTLKQVEEKYGDKIAVAFRNFPLPMHPDAPRAGEAGYCANDQGKFWEMHDKMFADGKALSAEALAKSAGEIGLEQAKFDECMSSGKYKERVEADKASGELVGVSGTPGFFINGVFLNGARPIESFTEVIDAELKRKGLM